MSSKGGARKGAGAPRKYTEAVKSKTFRFPLSIASHIEKKDNSTEYLIKLIELDAGIKAGRVSK